MFGKLSIIGCGLIGSSILRAAAEKKLASKISVFDNSHRVMEYLKKNFSVNICSNVSEASDTLEQILTEKFFFKYSITRCELSKTLIFDASFFSAAALRIEEPINPQPIMLNLPNI